MKSHPTAKSERHSVKAKGKGKGHTFLALPHYMLESEEYGQLSAHASKLLIEMARHYNGKNNGDLSAAWSKLKRRGWRSKSTLWAAINELLTAGFIRISRQGGRHHLCTLYSITWQAVDDCDGKLWVAAERVACNAWRKQKKSSLCGTQAFAMRTPEPEIAQKVA